MIVVDRVVGRSGDGWDGLTMMQSSSRRVVWFGFGSSGSSSAASSRLLFSGSSMLGSSVSYALVSPSARRAGSSGSVPSAVATATAAVMASSWSSTWVISSGSSDAVVRR